MALKLKKQILGKFLSRKMDQIFVFGDFCEMRNFGWTSLFNGKFEYEAGGKKYTREILIKSRDRYKRSCYLIKIRRYTQLENKVCFINAKKPPKTPVYPYFINLTHYLDLFWTPSVLSFITSGFA